MVKAVIFDMDGVLVDSSKANTQFFQSLLEKAGYQRPSPRKVEQCFHLTMRDTIKRLTKTNDSEEIKRIWKLGHDRSIYPTHLLQIPANLESIVKHLGQKYKLGVVTSRIRAGTEEFFAIAKVKRYFKVIITFEDYKKPKPHPESLLLAAKQLSVLSNEAVYVGDSSTDVEAAKAAGMKSVFLSSEHHNGADSRITSLDELVSVVSSLS